MSSPHLASIHGLCVETEKTHRHWPRRYDRHGKENGEGKRDKGHTHSKCPLAETEFDKFDAHTTIQHRQAGRE